MAPLSWAPPLWKGGAPSWGVSARALYSVGAPALCDPVCELCPKGGAFAPSGAQSAFCILRIEGRCRGRGPDLSFEVACCAAASALSRIRAPARATAAAWKHPLLVELSGERGARCVGDCGSDLLRSCRCNWLLADAELGRSCSWLTALRGSARVAGQGGGALLGELFACRKYAGVHGALMYRGHPLVALCVCTL